MRKKIQTFSKKILLPLILLTLILSAFTSGQTAYAASGSGSGGNPPAASSSCTDTALQSCSDACVSSNPMGWFLCKIYDGLGNFTNFLYSKVIQPLLKNKPVDLNPNNQEYQIWSSFRLYGNIFLIIAMLVIVFGESVGGGLLDAYTVKKVLPRLLAAAILINLSIYIVAILVDITNVIGGGIGSLLVPHPVANSPFHFSLSGAQTGEIGGGTLAMGSIFALLLAKGFAAGLAQGAIYLGLLFGSMIFFGFLALFLTLVIRQIGILLLIMISPIAFALYCLPNTEQYFKKWWDLLLELLMVYPFVAIFLSAADLFSIVGGATSSNDPVPAVISFVLQFVPLLAIPFAFRMASATLGKAHGALSGFAMKGHKGLTQRWGKKSKENAQSQFLQARARQYHSYKDKANNSSGLRRRAYGALAGSVGGYNMEAAIAEHNAKAAKDFEEQVSNGDDTEYRALTVDKSVAKDSSLEGVSWRKNANGVRQFKTLGGKWVNEADVDIANKRWGKNHAVLQRALAYEMSKATTQEEMDNLVTNYPKTADAWGMNEEEAQSAWIGAAFANQNSNRQFKHYSIKNGALSLNGKGLITEIDEKQGSYQMLQQHADTWTSMAQEVVAAKSNVDSLSSRAPASLSDSERQSLADSQEVLKRAARVAYATRSSSYSETGARASSEGAEAAPVVTAGGSRAAGAGAAGHTQEAINSFLAVSDQYAGRYQPPESSGIPTSEYIPAQPGDELALRGAHGRTEVNTSRVNQDIRDTGTMARDHVNQLRQQQQAQQQAQQQQAQQQAQQQRDNDRDNRGYL